MFLENVCCSRRRDRLCENSEMAFWKNEKRVLGPLAAKENAPYRNCGGRFSRVAGWRGVFAQSGKRGGKSGNLRGNRPRYLGGYNLEAASFSTIRTRSARDSARIFCMMWAR